jgi:hypothetical protein
MKDDDIDCCDDDCSELVEALEEDDATMLEDDERLEM